MIILGSLRVKLRKIKMKISTLILFMLAQIFALETIKSRNPNSMPMLIQAAKDVHEKEADNDTVKKLRFKVTQLEGQLD